MKDTNKTKNTKKNLLKNRNIPEKYQGKNEKYSQKKNKIRPQTATVYIEKYRKKIPKNTAKIPKYQKIPTTSHTSKAKRSKVSRVICYLTHTHKHTHTLSHTHFTLSPHTHTQSSN